VSVVAAFAVGVWETTGPFSGGFVVDPAFDQLLEAFCADGEELGSRIAGGSTDSSGSHASSDSPTFIQDCYLPAGVL
jgi:hypothetical protein